MGSPLFTKNLTIFIVIVFIIGTVFWSVIVIGGGSKNSVFEYIALLFLIYCVCAVICFLMILQFAIGYDNTNGKLYKCFFNPNADHQPPHRSRSVE